MLTKCPECELPVSDKAYTCPHCGYPLKSFAKKSHPGKSRMRLPNGFGQISELKGRSLRKPFRAMITVGKNSVGRPICKVLSYHETYNDAYAALVEYNKNPYDLDRSITISELYNKWTDQYFKNITESATRTIKSAWSYCGSVYNMKAQDLRVRHIKGCIDNCDKPSIKPRIKSMFNLMLDFAVEYEIVDKNYARDFGTERAVKQSDHIPFTTEELNIMWNHTDTPLVNAILVQCYMGWRPQELCKLKWSDVDWDQNIIIGGMKTDAGKNRIVPIHPIILPLLKKLKKLSDLLHSEYIVCSNDGSEMSYDKYNKRFHQILNDIDITGHRPHDPRITFVTLCKGAGVDEYAIKRIVGHALNDLTEEVYTKRDPEWLVTEISKIERNG